MRRVTMQEYLADPSGVLSGSWPVQITDENGYNTLTIGVGPPVFELPEFEEPEA